MKLLLDTHMLVWAIMRPELLPKKAGQLIDDPENEPYFSPVSLWEATIKHGKGLPDFDVDARVLRRHSLDDGYHELPITGAHATAVGDLPSIHKDPFDRLLLAQAKSEGILLLTSDDILAKYPVPLLHIPKRKAK